jgi:hypothetical protein
MTQISKIRLLPGDEIYLKNTFERYFTNKTGLLFRKEMNAFQGQRVRIISTIITYHGYNEKGIHRIIPTFSFVAVQLTTNKWESFPIICIDRSQPLIRDGKRITLIKKEIYIHMS